MDFSEIIIQASPYSIAVRGGFSDQVFADNSQSGYSTISGSLRIRAGLLTVEHVRIKP